MKTSNKNIFSENISHDSKILIEIFAYPMTKGERSVSAATPQKLLNQINKQGGKESISKRKHVYTCF